MLGYIIGVLLVIAGVIGVNYFFLDHSIITTSFGVIVAVVTYSGIYIDKL